MINSSITNSSNTTKIKNINVRYIIKTYKKILPNLEIEKYFDGLSNIEIYECDDTGYKFFHPQNLHGDKEFYYALGKLPWYYSNWKFEHESALKYINEKSKVLEVGAGKGHFLKQVVKRLNCSCVGLELNPDIENIQKENRFVLKNESIEEHCVKNKEIYDVVCSFQVLEHISEVNSFIESMLSSLKPGGRLIIGVPNNDSFIKDNPLNTKVLNMPPHHMGLWNKKSLSNIAKVYDLELENLILEPLQKSNITTYIATRAKKILINNFIFRIYWKLNFHKLSRFYVKKKLHKIDGHSIIAIYKKVINAHS